MKEKLVSIILPVYNGANNISSAIESIINQTYINWELIIVNDCSTDNTLEIINSYQMHDHRIRIFSNSVNLKLPRTLNKGFAYAKGEYLTWTSDDNIYKPNAIEYLVRELEKSTDIDMVYSDYTNIDASGNVISEGKLLDSDMIFIGNVIGACFLYTADIACKVGEYDANLFLAEDYDYWIRIYRYGKIKHIPVSLYYYRRHALSLTETKSALINVQTYKALEKNFAFLYMQAKRKGMQYKLFDQILFRVGSANYESTKSMLVCINKKYRYYLLKQDVKEKIMNYVCTKREK